MSGASSRKPSRPSRRSASSNRGDLTRQKRVTPRIPGHNCLLARRTAVSPALRLSVCLVAHHLPARETRRRWSEPAVFFRLSSLELRAADLRSRARHDAPGCRGGATATRARRRPARAGRRVASGATRSRRAHSRVRPDAGRGALRLAEGRGRRTANAIGTTYLRAQTLREPMRTRSLEDLGAIRMRPSACRRRSRVVRPLAPRSQTAIACTARSGAEQARRSTALRPTAPRASTSKPSTR